MWNLKAVSSSFMFSSKFVILIPILIMMLADFLSRN